MAATAVSAQRQAASLLRRRTTSASSFANARRRNRSFLSTNSTWCELLSPKKGPRKMAEIYPVPKYAAYIWLTGNVLHIGLPPGEEAERGHTVAISLDKCALARPAGEWERENGMVDLARYVGT